ncbi:MAG TPA: FtsX-like permease family protein, partial [Rugosimonospora sp.]|nr:FtsX-like permease family protein [Rugosimonospora sp.]
MSRRLTGLVMGLRFAVAGGRGGWTRAAMTAVGVGLGVALLLVAAAIPAMLQARSDRGTGRAAPLEDGVAPSDRTVVVAQIEDQYHGELVYGMLVRPDGGQPVVPPGLTALPGPGQAVVSPALRRLLDSGDGALLRPRIPYQIVGTIGDEGLLGPSELAYYAGDATLVAGQGAQRIDRFGDDPDTEPFAPALALLAIIGFVVLLLPVAVFVATAVRFGGDGRDRRLAALRLAGADRVTARWISAGEALAGAVVGLGVGGLLLFAFRSLVSRMTVWDISVYGRDVRPDPVFAALIVVAVPVLAVAVTLLSLRRVSIEPLGVVRRGGRVRRRVWWRVLLPVAGLLVLAPSVRRMRATHSDPSVYPVAAGVVLLLIGVTALLPWLVEAVVRRLRGGPVPWQLATRRLQLDSGTAARLVSGIAVAVAGGIGLQMLFAGVQGGFTRTTGADPSRYQIGVSIPAAEPPVAALQQVPGVRGAISFTESWVSPAGSANGDGTDLLIAGCATLLQLTDADGCSDGDVFLVTDPRPGTVDEVSVLAPGTAI